MNAVSETLAWHAIPQNEVVQRLATSCERGLEPTEVSARLGKYGLNRLPQGRQRGPFARFLSQFNNILIYVLLAAGVIKLIQGLWVDAGIIFCVVLFNSLLGFIQEGKAEKALDSIRNMLSSEARTIRGGETRIISADQLVPGDIVLVESGDKVPADLRLVDARTYGPKRQPSLVNQYRRKRQSMRCPRMRPSEIAGAWRFPARWSCPAVRLG